ncbi:hypothetical protein SDC9_169476 [bioreactor metagenome]|uniref:Uncharacterized protein n=1 Tax=bioreactor metagenome TaxID=1076179 RepID=A0A645GE64_9ZZZZ
MPVNGTKISDIEPFEHILLLGNKRFYAVVEAKYNVFLLFRNEIFTFDGLINPVPHFIVFGRGSHFNQIILNPTHITVDRHVVVVEDDKQVVWL